MHRDEVTFKRKFLVCLFSILILFGCFSVQQAAFANGVQPLVETSWLADNLNNPSLSIVYVGGPASKQENFEAKHIPGSVFLDFFTLMGIIGDGSTPPNKAKFEALAGGLGISNDKHVIIHSGDSLFGAGAFWLFDYFGHKKLSMMNGTIAKWMNEGRPTAAGSSAIKPASYKASPNSAVFATADDVLKDIKNPKAVIVDTRGADEYTGKMSPPGVQNKLMGRIPGSVHLDFYSTNLNNDGTFKAVKDLKPAYEAKGVTKDKEVVTYCQAGIRAAHSYFVIKHLLGYPNVKNYIGSWGEWGNRLDAAKYPVEK